MTERGKKWTGRAALLVLACALVFFNLPSAAAPSDGESAPLAAAEAFVSDAPAGCRVGEQLPDFSILQTDGQEFTLSRYRGRVTVINLWATWCGPCVKELPYFDSLQRRYPEGVKVLALHVSPVTDDVNAWLSGYDYGIAFAVDEEGGVAPLLGASALLPQTLVLNARGEVTYNQTGSVTEELLEELVRAAEGS